MRTVSIIIAFLLIVHFPYAQVPVRLTTDLLEHTDKVFLDGYPSSLSLSEIGSAIERHQTASIRNPNPYFGWVIESSLPNTIQIAYRVLLASSIEKLQQNEGDIWDSGKVENGNSVSVPYIGESLEPSRVYFWKVKIWDNHGNEGNFSAIKSFITASVLDGKTSYYPLQIVDEYPVNITTPLENTTFADFEKAAFGKLKLTLTSETGKDTVVIRLGEKATNGQIERKPGGSIRSTAYSLPLLAGTHTYTVKFKPDERNTALKKNESGVDPILMPEYIGEVYPFRYCEIENYQSKLSEKQILRQSVFYPFNDLAATFHSSDTVLNKVWDLCQYSIKMTSFMGVYIDGDRERIPYEADALINQLCHYFVDREFSMARYTHEHLLLNPTWPTEWNLISVLMAWNDYLYTGNKVSLDSFYEILKAKTLLALKEENGLISTRTGRMNPDFYKTIHFKGKSLRDIVDWPQSGITGNEKNEPGEADGFVFTTYNTVVNAYHYEALRLLSLIANVLGYADDQKLYTTEANRVKIQFNKLLFNKTQGYYADGIETDHSSLHANMFPVAFGMVPEKNLPRVMEFIRSRGMACSVYGAQFLMDALYNASESEYGLGLLTSTQERGWYNMTRSGSTVTLEAWDIKYKPNLDWNHAWGAVPANIIPRKLMGIEPLEPGFGKIRIKPQPASLHQASIKVPSVRGDIRVSFRNEPDKKFELEVEIPANTTAEVWMPRLFKKPKLWVDGNLQKGTIDGSFLKILVGSGKHTLLIE